MPCVLPFPTCFWENEIPPVLLSFPTRRGAICHCADRTVLYDRGNKGGFYGYMVLPGWLQRGGKLCPV